MRIPDIAGLAQIIPLKRSTTNKSKETAQTTLDRSSEDDMIEMGQEQKNNEIQQRRQRRAVWSEFILKVRLELFVAMTIMVGLIAVMAYVLVASRRSDTVTTNTHNNESADNLWYKTPPLSGGGFEPAPSPTQPSPSQPLAFVKPGGPPLPSIDEQLSEVIEMSRLQDRRTPIGRAYRWISQQDDLKSINNYPTVVQRFTLAAFYFSTGGGRTSATWEMCSAVPTDLAMERNTFSTRCVMDDGVEDEEVLCAKAEAFLECDEHLANMELPPPEFPKRRWLSGVSECDWYGVSCDHNGIVEELFLPKNGLVGTLLPELDLLNNLKSLDLAGNALIGDLPEWKEWKHMEHIVLSLMSLQGQIPDSWQAWSELETLDLGENELSGDVVLPGEWRQLYKVILANNNFDITLQSDIGKTAVRLSTLDLAGNNVDDTLPESMSQLENLTTLDLSDCGMWGTIPNGIGALTNLGTLRFWYGILFYSDSAVFLTIMIHDLPLSSPFGVRRELLQWYDPRSALATDQSTSAAYRPK
jgi:hypothetical protein